ncbi:MAG: DUF488 family protein [Actinomycetes bacterium]
MSRSSGPTLHTIGHGGTPAARFAAVLHDAGVEVLVDVRRYPGSTRVVQFRRDQLDLWLPEHGLEHVHEGTELGGMLTVPPEHDHAALVGTGLEGYPDHLTTPPARAALDRVVELAAHRPVALLCVETDWRSCHRRLLADRLVAFHGATVRHLSTAGVEEHTLGEEVRVDGDRLVYDVGVDRPLF